MALPDKPLNRIEQYLAKIGGDDVSLPDCPLNRIEIYLAKIAGQDVALPDGPLDRIEQYLAEIAGGAGNKNPYTKIGSGEFLVSTTDTADTEIGTITLDESLKTSDKMIYVKVRDKAGSRPGYFYGCDAFCSSVHEINNTVGTSIFAYLCYRVDSSGKYIVTIANSASNAKGVYPYNINVGQPLSLKVNAQYSASTSLTIDGTFSVEVYLLEWPGDITPFVPIT